MPQLAEHQLRVGGVGQLVAESWIHSAHSTGSGQAGSEQAVDVERVTQVCLLHDMGNLVKFDLSDEAKRDSMFGKASNLPYWREVQSEYWARYGKDAHVATKGILKDAGIEWMNKYIDEEGELYFAEALGEKLEKASVEAVILMYADFRVKPEGIVSYKDRVNDLRERYGGGKTPTWYEWTQEFERWIEEKTEISLASITEELVRPKWDELLSVKIS